MGSLCFNCLVGGFFCPFLSFFLNTLPASILSAAQFALIQFLVIQFFITQFCDFLVTIRTGCVVVGTLGSQQIHPGSTLMRDDFNYFSHVTTFPVMCFVAPTFFVLIAWSLHFS